MGFGSQILGFGAFPSRGPGAYVPTHAAVFDGSAEYLQSTPTKEGSRYKYTIATWFKHGTLGLSNTGLFSGDTSNAGFLRFSSDAIDFGENGGSQQILSTAKFRDPTAWYHVVASWDSGNATANDRMIVYVNGARIPTADLATNTQPSHYLAGTLNQAGEPFNIGAVSDAGPGQFWSGALAETIFLDGVVVAPTVFGEYDSSTGIWVPKNPLAGYGEDTQDKNIADWGGVNSLYFNFSDTNDLGKNFRPTEVTANPGTYKIDYSIYFDGSSQYLDQASAFSSAPTDADKYSLSMWLKRVEPGTAETFAHSNPSASEYEQVKFNTDDIEYQYNFNDGGGDFGFSVNTTALYSDATAWMHFMLRRDSGVVDTFVNGVKVATSTVAQRTATDTKHGHFNDTAGVVEFGRRNYPGGSAAEYYHGYMAEVIFLDGYFAEPTDLGGWDANGIWMPVDPTSLLSSSRGTNGFALQFKGDGSTFDSNADSGGVGADTSGNNHHFRGQGSVHNNRVTDTPTNTSGDNEGNYATFNPIASSDRKGGLSNGNLKASGVSKDNFSTMNIPLIGKWYFEATLTAVAGTGKDAVGVVEAKSDQTGAYGSTITVLYAKSGEKFLGSSWESYNATYAAGDIIGVYINAGQVTFYKNNASQGTCGSAFTTQCFATTQNANAATVWDINFGQKGFNYTPPTDAKALNTANFTAPTYTDAHKYFAPVIYEGAGSTRSVRGCFDSSGTAWTPDWVWIKNREQTDDHRLFDTLRGPFHYLETNSNVAQSQGNIVTSMLTEFTSGGFKISNNVSVNTANEGYVAWCWRAGGAPTVDNDNTSGAMDDGSVFKGGTVQSSYTPSGSPSIYPKKMSIAEHGGFSIVQYVGNGSAGATIPHGLDAAADFQIFKRLRTPEDVAATQDWHVGTDVTGSIIGVELNNATGTVTAAVTAFNTHTTALASSGVVNDNTDTYISYAFTKTPGLIGIGSYTGGGSDREPFVVVDDGASGFRPAWVMLKNVSASQDWEIHDIAREPNNIAGGGTFAGRLQPSTTAADSTTFVLQKTSNGFKIRTTGASTNGSGNTFIYLAFADQAFQLQARAL